MWKYLVQFISSFQNLQGRKDPDSVGTRIDNWCCGGLWRNYKTRETGFRILALALAWVLEHEISTGTKQCRWLPFVMRWNTGRAIASKTTVGLGCNTHDRQHPSVVAKEHSLGCCWPALFFLFLFVLSFVSGFVFFSFWVCFLFLVVVAVLCLGFRVFELHPFGRRAFQVRISNSNRSCIIIPVVVDQLTWLSEEAFFIIFISPRKCTIVTGCVWVCSPLHDGQNQGQFQAGCARCSAWKG